MNLYNSLGQKFSDTIRDYQAAQQKYKATLTGKATRQILALKPDATEDDVHSVLESADKTENFLKSAFLTGTDVSDAIQIEYQSITSKHDDILTLERSVAEVHQMFLDLAFLTETQGRVLDHIELNVKRARDHVEVGNENVVKTIKTQKKIRKKNW